MDEIKRENKHKNLKFERGMYGDIRIQKPTSQNHKDGESTHLDLSKMIELAFEDVGEDFYDEAIKMYTGESEKRAIKGTLTENEEAELDEEGISFFKLPNIQ